MRAYLPAYHLEPVRDLNEVLDRLSQDPGQWKLFAGGTDLMVLLEAGKLSHRFFLNVWKLPELRGIEVTPDFVAIGAATTYTELRSHGALAREFPMLCQAASETGAVATQNRGTIGGNIANASPAADSPPALLAYDAEIEIVSSGGASSNGWCYVSPLGQGWCEGNANVTVPFPEVTAALQRYRAKWREEPTPPSPGTP